MKRIVQLLVAFGACALASSANATVILTYEFDGNTTPTPTTYASGGSTLLQNNVSAAVQASGGQSGGYLKTGNYNGYNTPPASGDRYWGFTITPTAGYNVSVNTISAYLQVNGGSLSSMYAAIYPSGAVNGSTPLGLSSTVTVSGLTTFTSRSFTFNTPVALSAGTTYEVRFFGAGSPGLPSDFLNFDQLTVDASASPVPEPVNIALVLFALGGTGVYAGRRWLRRK
jgi:hypothetical protein